MIEEHGKMTAKPTLDRKVYATLLSEVLPTVITTEEENERFIAVIETLLEKGADRSEEETELLKLLTLLVEKFEEEHYPLPMRPEESTPSSMIQFLMDQKDLEQKDLYHLFGSSRGLTSDVINGKRRPSKKQAKALADFFNVSVEFFL
jgi:HTH-type transcriptional regulator / antitoxin HigA